ncbi:MAG: hypothetical protein ATN36_07310 [Epulopiscium sp. Nele67-Bin005]|nr:MAG: hypothetical protein ATN36_07310 [Epulopiscium sp. Nele67-Bin005]
MVFEFNYILVGLMQIVGFFVQGCTGFGCTVIAASVTNGFLGTEIGVPYGTLITLPFLLYLGITGIKDVSWKDLGKIVVLCLPGLFIGNYLTSIISETQARIGIGAMVTFIATMNIYKCIIKPLVLKHEVSDEDVPDTPIRIAVRYGALLLGGIVHGAFNIGGPLITVYTIAAVKQKEKFRNTMTWVWIVLNSINAVNFYNAGRLASPELWGSLAVGVPMAGVGFYFGMRYLAKINREQFLRVVYVVLFIIGADMLIRNLMVLF